MKRELRINQSREDRDKVYCETHGLSVGFRSLKTRRYERHPS